MYRTLRKVTSTNMRKNMYVVTPGCAAAAAAVVSAVVLRRPTKEYTHPYSYSRMHRRLPTAGIEVAPHYHQLPVGNAPMHSSLAELHTNPEPTFARIRRFPAQTATPLPPSPRRTAFPKPTPRARWVKPIRGLGRKPACRKSS